MSTGLISANFSADTLTVLTNNGSGGFVLSSSPGAGFAPFSLTTADVNGNGQVDLISANFSASTLTVLTNNGSGGFVLSSSPGVGLTPVSVTAADVNGDGMVDLISANSDSHTLTVLTNNGSGSFVLSSSPGVGGGPFAVTAADVNGDGRVDLISANASDTTLSVLFNTPTFTGKFAGDGAELSGLSAANIASGRLADLRLSTNVAFLNRNQSFTGNNTFSGGVAIGASGSGTQQDQLRLQDPVTGTRFASFGVNTNSDLFIQTHETGTGASGNIILETGFPSGAFSGGRVGIGTSTPQQKLHVIGNILASGTITGASDRHVKRDFAPVDSRQVLDQVAALPISTWSYIAEDGVRHLGPMAQDFYSAFNVGLNDKHISMVDADGVALAAIQGLNQKLEERVETFEKELQRRDVENAELRNELATIKSILSKLTQTKEYQTKE